MSLRKEVIRSTCTTSCLFVLLASLIPVAAFAEEPLKFIGFDKESHSQAAHQGLLEIYSGRLFHSGIPAAAMEAMAQAGNPNSQLGYDPKSPAGRHYASSKVPSPLSRKSKLALGDSMFDRGGVTLVNANCFYCHAGVVNGQVVAGLPNNRIIPPNKSSDAPSPADMKRAFADLKDAADKKEFREFIASVSNQLVLPKTASRGDHFGPYLVWNAGAHLANPERTGLLATNDKTDLVKLIESMRVPNVDPMPWWLMKYKKKDYWYADGGINDAAHFSFNFTILHQEANANHAAHVESTRKALAFARETQSPLFPKPLNAQLVQRGADIFHERTKPENPKGFVACKTCHGTYTKKRSKLNLEEPGGWSVKYHGSEVLKSVGTDATYNRTLQKLRPIGLHVNKLAAYYKAKGTPQLTPRFSVPSKKGYVAPPLVGVWASAPYFHNGSVPTIEAVLNSELRPEIWLRNITDPHAYNLEQVGLKHRCMSRPKFNASERQAAIAHARSKAVIRHQAIYDTKSFGHGNVGHRFGDQLTTAERSAVIEFLKSLSGPDM